MKENSRMWLFLFGKNVTRRQAVWFAAIDVLFLLGAIMLLPFGSTGDPFDLGGKGSLYYKAKQAVTSYRVAHNEQKAKKEIAAPISGYSFVRYYHLVVADTKKDQAYYYGQTAAIFKGENNYLLCYKADGKAKKLPFKKWSANCDGIIVEDGSIIRFADVSPDKEGCEFAFCKNAAFCEYYFWRKV